MAARFDLAARLLQRTIRQITSAHPCIAIDSCKKWWCVVKDRGKVHDAQIAGLANCRYVAHQSYRQGKHAPKGYIARQEMTLEIAHIHIGRLHNGMLWMQWIQVLKIWKYFFLVPILVCVERQSMQLLVSPVKMVCIHSETNDYWKAKVYRPIIWMDFHRNKT